MRSAIWFFVVAMLTGACFLFLLLSNANGFSIRQSSSFLEAWTARQMRQMAVPDTAKHLINPVPDSPEVITQARAHWADHCASCHANNGSGDIALGRHLYPPAPDMRQPQTQNLTDGQLFYIIENGIRLTGMPAWGNGTPQDEQDSWKLVRFIRHLPAITATEEEEMKELNPRTPDELKEEQEERDFLNGDNSNVQPGPHHH